MKRKLPLTPTALFAALVLAGPMLRAAGPTDAPTVPTLEKSSPGGVEVSSARGRWVKGRLLVSGVVHRKAGYAYPGPLPSHLDFVVLDANQRSLSVSQIDYLPRTIPIVYRGIPSQATYAGYLPIVPPTGATVRVAHHQASIEECRQDHPTANPKEAPQPASARGKYRKGSLGRQRF